MFFPVINMGCEMDEYADAAAEVDRRWSFSLKFLPVTTTGQVEESIFRGLAFRVAGERGLSPLTLIDQYEDMLVKGVFAPYG